MRKTIKKLFWAWDFDKEETWLNEMAAKGLAMVSYGFCRYEFEETEPGEYRVAIELLPHALNHPESEQYLRFLEETGIELVGSWMRWIYVRKKTDGGDFELLSDRKSKVEHLVRILILVGIVGALNLYSGFYNFFVWTRFHNGISVFAACLGFALALLATFGAVRLGIKACRIARERRIYED
jgi:hypothetical protein